MNSKFYICKEVTTMKKKLLLLIPLVLLLALVVLVIYWYPVTTPISVQLDMYKIDRNCNEK